MKNLFRTILLTGLLLLAVDLAAAKAQWHTDVESALKQASETKKPIMVLITGSSWCRPCQNLEKKVWSSEEFARFAKKNLILVKADFPRKKKLAAADVKLAKAVIKKYPAINRKVPSVYLLDPAGKVLFKTLGYNKNNAAQYKMMLKGIDATAEKGKKEKKKNKK